MNKCNKLNCPMQYNKVADDCDIKDCPYRTTDKIEDRETALKFLAMIFVLSEEQRKECVEKVKRDYGTVKEIEKEEVAKPTKELHEKRAIAEMANVMMEHCEIDNQCGSCHWSTCNDCLAEVLYNAGYRKQEWISVEDRLPEIAGKYLIARKTVYGNLINIVWYDTNYNGGNDDMIGKSVWYMFDSDWGDYEIPNVTHWMPLPQPPKMKGGE